MWGCLLVFVAFGFIGDAFKKLYFSRKILDIATSKIATGAVGSLVELKGQVHVDNELRCAPISGQECAFWMLSIEKLVLNKKHSESQPTWRKHGLCISDDHFFLKDDSDAYALVLPLENGVFSFNERPAELELDRANLSNYPKSLDSFFVEFGQTRKEFSKKNVFLVQNNGGKVRFKEWIIQPRDQVYVLGYAHSGIQFQKGAVGSSILSKIAAIMMRRLKYWGKFLDKYGAPIKKRNFSVFMLIKELHAFYFKGGKKKYTDELVEVLAAYFETFCQTELLKKTKMVFIDESAHPLQVSTCAEMKLSQRYKKDFWSYSLISGPITFLLGGILLFFAFSFLIHSNKLAHFISSFVL